MDGRAGQDACRHEREAGDRGAARSGRGPARPDLRELHQLRRSRRARGEAEREVRRFYLPGENETIFALRTFAPPDLLLDGQPETVLWQPGRSMYEGDFRNFSGEGKHNHADPVTDLRGNRLPGGIGRFTVRAPSEIGVAHDIGRLLVPYLIMFPFVCAGRAHRIEHGRRPSAVMA